MYSPVTSTAEAFLATSVTEEATYWHRTKIGTSDGFSRFATPAHYTDKTCARGAWSSVAKLGTLVAASISLITF